MFRIKNGARVEGMMDNGILRTYISCFLAMSFVDKPDKMWEKLSKVHTKSNVLFC
mgnify:CR=1 FL=1